MTRKRRHISAAAVLAALSFFAAQAAFAALANRAARGPNEAGTLELSGPKRSSSRDIPVPALRSAALITAYPLPRAVTPIAAKLAASGVPAAVAQTPSAPAWEPTPSAADAAEALSQHRQDGYQALLDRLDRSGSRLSAEDSKDISAAFFAPLTQACGSGSDVAAADPARSLPAALAAPTPGAAAASSWSRPAPRPFSPAQGWSRSLKESLHSARIYLDSYRWYNFTHLQDLWKSYSRKHEAAREYGRRPAVSEARSFFVGMRIMISSGRFNIVGFSSRTDPALLDAARREFRRYFDSADTETTAAFERFLTRAESYNRAKRAHSYMSRQVRDNMLAASLLPMEDLAAFFDSKLKDDNQAAADEFQRERMPRLLAEFKQVILETAAEEDAEDPDRVTGVLLFGGFARGSATDNSDFDVEAITRSGSPRRLPDFNRRMLARWARAGHQQANPINMHEYALLPSKSLIRRFHNNNYIIVSPDPAQNAGLSHRPADRPLVKFVCDMDAKARLGNAVLELVANAATYWQDLKTELAR